MSMLARRLIKNSKDAANPDVRRAYATLSSVAGILLNLFLCGAKIAVGRFSGSVAISVDGWNNLADAGTNLASLLGFRIARYGGGRAHPFGHGRVEWIMGMLVSASVLLVGIRQAGASLAAVANPHSPAFGAAPAAVLLTSILVKAYMFVYNRNFARIIDSETLKATAADCISDSMATGAVLLSSLVSRLTCLELDGYCGALVSGFIVFSGLKSLWEILGRIMGRDADAGAKDAILQIVRRHPEIGAVYDLMLHDYGFGSFVISMRVAGSRQDGERLYAGVHQIACELRQKFYCDCFIQADYLMEDEALARDLREKIEDELKRYGGVEVEHFRLIESGCGVIAAFDAVYPARLQKCQEKIREDVERRIELENPGCRALMKGVLRRERLGPRRKRNG